MKNSNKPLTTGELRALFEKIQGAENKEMATKAYVTALALPHYSQMLERDPLELTDAEKIECDWFQYGLAPGQENPFLKDRRKTTLPQIRHRRTRPISHLS